MATAVNGRKQKSRKAGRQRSLLKLLDSKKQSPLLWALPESLIESLFGRSIDRQHALSTKSKQAKLAAEILSCVSKTRPKMVCPLDVLGVLSVVHCLSHVSEQFDAVEIGSISDWLFERVNGTEFDLETSPEMFQLANVELPLSVVYGLSMADAPMGLADEAAQRFGRCVSKLLDGDGWPEARRLDEFGTLVASWTRCYLILQHMRIPLSSDVAFQLEWLVRQTLRMLRADDSLMLSQPKIGINCKAFERALMAMSNDKLDHRVAKLRFSAENSKTHFQKELPEESSVSEWAQLGALQCDWQRGSPKVGFAYHEGRLNMEIANDVSLIRGNCTPQVSINGRPHFVDDVIEMVCWETNKDVDYVELQLGMGPVTLQRQILLNRANQFLVVADVVIPPEASRIDYRCEFPFSDDIQGVAESETREIYLRKETKNQSLVLPLGLPEWKNARTDDSFLTVNRGLQLTQSINGRGLLAAVFFVLNRKHSTKPRTWRRLTVAERIEIVPDDVAVAFRVLLGRHQWVYYRSIGDKGNRTFFGENISSEFFVGKLDRDGAVRALLEIEG